MEYFDAAVTASPLRVQCGCLQIGPQKAFAEYASAVEYDYFREYNVKFPYGIESGYRVLSYLTQYDIPAQYLYGFAGNV